MWRRVASQSPDQSGEDAMNYKLAYAAMSDLLMNGNSLSGRERNSLFLHCGNRLDLKPQRMANASTATGFAYEDDTRGVVTVDWDFDGDLDVWLTNRTAPRLRFLRNELSADATWIAFKLEGTTSNRDGIGARLTLETASGRKLRRSRRAGEGFLSQNSAWVHVGLGRESGEVTLQVDWSDGQSETFAGLSTKAYWQVRQGDSPRLFAPPGAGKPPLATGKAEGHAWQTEARTVLVSRLPMPQIQGEEVHAGSLSPGGRTRGKLLVFFAPWCQPCVREMAELVQQAAAFRERGLEVQAVEVPGLDAPTSSSTSIGASQTTRLMKKLGWPYPVVRLAAEEAGALDVFHRSFLSLRRPLPLPTGFLIDADDRLAVIYRGPVTAERVLEDAALLPKSAGAIRQNHLPFQGRWHAVEPPQPDVVSALVAWKREGYLAAGQAYLERYLVEARPGLTNTAEAKTRWVLLCEHLADFHRLQQDPRFLRAYEMALEVHPNYVPALAVLGNHHGREGRLDEALDYLNRAVKLAPDDPQVLLGLGIAHVKKQEFAEARRWFAQMVNNDPANLQARLYLCQMYLETKDWKAAGAEIRVLWRAMPGQAQVVDLVQRLRPHLDPQAEEGLKADLNAVLRERNRARGSGG